MKRGWPDTTTFLIFNDYIAHSEMEAEITTYERDIEYQKVKSQDKAF